MKTCSSTKQPSSDVIQRAALRRAISERIAKELFYADVLDGLTEKGATWESATTDDREHYLTIARAMLRRDDPIIKPVAVNEAAKAAIADLGQHITFVGKERMKGVVRVIVAAYQAHMGRPDDHAKEMRAFEQIAGIQEAQPLSLVPGGRS